MSILTLLSIVILGNFCVDIMLYLDVDQNCDLVFIILCHCFIEFSLAVRIIILFVSLSLFV